VQSSPSGRLLAKCGSLLLTSGLTLIITHHISLCGLCYRVAGWLNCFINGCWILVAACMVLASRRAPKGALIVSLSFLVMILPEDILKEACFLSNIVGYFNRPQSVH
jgi:hypothetical protein